ncbi:hypothetical protein BC829DRAFT_443093 [Chytridium lagenaria]|nr:hypothetical protein BC829DRAFT_443093 [Chytridium lagenaria]
MEAVEKASAADRTAKSSPTKQHHPQPHHGNSKKGPPEVLKLTHNQDLPPSTWAHPEAFLPRLNQQEPMSNRALSATYFSQMESLLEQMDRMRSMMREKEVDYLKIRHENIVFKAEAPAKGDSAVRYSKSRRSKVIKGLREEVAGLKQKIKAYFSQLNVDSRQIRTLNDECRKLRDHGQRLESLVASKELLEREELTKQILDSSKKLMEQEKVATEAIRRGEMIEKNVTTENRQLRGKIHNYEKENTFLKEKTETLEEQIKDKDKEIASLSIYRYNAIHRKVETTCKKCEQRSKEETEMRRRQSILEKLPQLSKAQLVLEGATSVTANFSVPPINTDTCEGMRFTLRYSADSTFTSDVKNIVISPAVPSKSRSRAPSVIRQDASKSRDHPSEPHLNHDARQSSLHRGGEEVGSTEMKERAASEAKSTMNRSCKVTGLTSGLVYYFQLFASMDDVDGPPSEINSILVDELPLAPPKPAIVVSTTPPLITVIIQASDLGSGSHPLRFQVYHGNDADLKEAFLIGEVDATTPPETTETTETTEDTTTTPSTTFFYHYQHPQTAVPHYFKIAAINAMGMGKFSDISSCAMIGNLFFTLQLPTPSAYRIHRHPTPETHTSNCHDNQGSDIECWRILYTKVSNGDEVNPAATTTIFTTPLGVTGMGKLECAIESLEPGAGYVFAVAAINGSGESDHSEFSEEIVLDEMIPIADPPHIQILSPTSIKVTPIPLPATYTGPKVVAYRINLTTTDTVDMKPHTVTVRKNIDEAYAVVDRLDAAASYWLGFVLLGKD